MPLGIALLLAEDVEPDARINLGFLHLVSIGEGEGTADICKLAGCEQVALGYGTIADNIDIDIGDFNELVFGFVHVGLDLADGQLASQFLTHDGRTGLGDIELEVSLGGNGANVWHTHDLA